MEVSTIKSNNPERTRAWNAAMSAHHGDLDLLVPAEKITGTIPASLRGGRMLSNGPGWTIIGGRIAHPFDGHGYVRSFHLLNDGTCRLRARYVETPSYIAERKAQRLVHRGLATNL
jgi:carotenoid cleavage dioxygenase-like enzyme